MRVFYSPKETVLSMLMKGGNEVLCLFPFLSAQLPLKWNNSVWQRSKITFKKKNKLWCFLKMWLNLISNPEAVKKSFFRCSLLYEVAKIIIVLGTFICLNQGIVSSSAGNLLSEIDYRRETNKRGKDRFSLASYITPPTPALASKSTFNISK